MMIRATLILGLTTALIAVLIPSWKEERLDRQVRSTLLVIQEALQNYHVDEELYPTRSPLSGRELIALLIEHGHLESAPHNPWTGAPYEISTSEEDTSESDRIRYRTDDLAETYSLEALRADSDEIHHVLDSTEHPSLE